MSFTILADSVSSTWDFPPLKRLSGSATTFNKFSKFTRDVLRAEKNVKSRKASQRLSRRIVQRKLVCISLPLGTVSTGWVPTCPGVWVLEVSEIGAPSTRSSGLPPIVSRFWHVGCWPRRIVLPPTVTTKRCCMAIFKRTIRLIFIVDLKISLRIKIYCTVARQVRRRLF